MNICEAWKNEIRGLLPCGFVKISRDEGFLFVSDYPKRMENTLALHRALVNAGFSVTVERGMAYLDGTLEKYRQADAETDFPCPPPMTEENARLHHAAHLLAAQGGPVQTDSMFLVRHILRCSALADDKGLSLVPGMVARMKREKELLPALAGKILFCYLSKK
ncbi:MAG: hypothetical protein IJB69_05015 [Clostridia bacterium]|nr:hypothetical protein [Clostridia bacterium]